MRFFVQISKYFKKNPIFVSFIYSMSTNSSSMPEIPPNFKDIALNELGHNKQGAVRVQNKVYECSIVHSGGDVFIDGKGIAKIASDFNISKGDVVFFEYHGNAFFYCIVCCGYTYMEKNSLGSRTPVRFFVEAISYDGLLLTRSSKFKHVLEHGRLKSNMGLHGACWQSFHDAHNLCSSMYIQMDYHGNGNFTPTIFKQNSCCEQPFSLNGMLFVKVEESFQELKCPCNIETIDTNGNGENVNAADNIDTEDQLNVNTPQFQNYIPVAKLKKHHTNRSKVVIFVVLVHPYKNNGKTVRVRLTQGWTKFSNDNNLRIGAKIKINLLSPPEQDHSDGKTLYMSISFK
ncbi:hypothetical protein ACJIZ3_008884 [Penstemon smallii]|uniref:TF-B3 domain-containing protein n=1 Tax=Penstemon smallii TaxID=265156 RepID=A0ABD3TCN9_9LAMI